MRYLTDSSGSIVNAYDYDSYGRPMFGVTQFDQPFAYTGREWDAATGLYHYRARAYDAETGRFLQEDPIGLQEFDANPYKYAGLNPLFYKDPTGFSAIESTGAFTQAAGTSGQISNVGFGISCLFNTIAASVEYEADFVSGRGDNGALACGGRVVDRARDNAIIGSLVDFIPKNTRFKVLAFEIGGIARNPYIRITVCEIASVCVRTRTITKDL